MQLMKSPNTPAPAAFISRLPMLGSFRDTLHSALCGLLNRFRPVSRDQRADDPVPVLRQLDLDLDSTTASGLTLRHAMAVRSAEFWLQLHQPDRALDELQSLPEPARYHEWPLRVHLRAVHSPTSPCS